MSIERHFDDIGFIVAQQEEFVRQGEIESAASCLPLFEAQLSRLVETIDAAPGERTAATARLRAISDRYSAMRRQVEEYRGETEAALGQAAGRMERARVYAVAEACG